MFRRFPAPTMAAPVKLTLLAALLAGAGPLSESAAQSDRQRYAVRQALRNEAYPWEPILLRTDPSAPQPRNRPAAGRSPAPETPVAIDTAPAPISPAARSVLNYFGNADAAAVLNRAPSRRPVYGAKPQPIVDQAVVPASGERPFEGAAPAPTISPYLGLYREGFDDNANAASFYTTVQPQLEQRRRLRQQRVDDQRQAREARAPVATGAATRFGNTSQFYGRWSR